MASTNNTDPKNAGRPPKWIWFVLLVGIPLFVMLFFVPAQEKKSAHPATYRSLVCDDAWRHDIQEPPGDMFVVKFTEACFDGKHYLPGGWNGWRWQAVGNDPDWWVAFWPEGEQEPSCCYGAHDGFAHFYTPMRFQGKPGAEIRIYTTSYSGPRPTSSR